MLYPNDPNVEPPSPITPSLLPRDWQHATCDTSTSAPCLEAVARRTSSLEMHIHGSISPPILALRGNQHLAGPTNNNHESHMLLKIGAVHAKAMGLQIIHELATFSPVTSRLSSDARHGIPDIAGQVAANHHRKRMISCVTCSENAKHLWYTSPTLGNRAALPILL